MIVRDRTAARIESHAKTFFAGHQVTEHAPLDIPGGRFGWWKVQKPGTWCYGYYVTNVPGMVHVHGDIADITVSRLPDTCFDWFVGITDLHYFEEKVLSRPKRTGTDWSSDVALECLASMVEQRDLSWRDSYVQEIKRAIGYEQGPQPLYDTLTGDDWEYFSDCSDWDTSIPWGYWALRKFVDLTVGWPEPVGATTH